MASNIIKYLVIDAERTIGKNVLALECHRDFNYNEGVKGMQKGLKFKCLSEVMGYEKVDVKIDGIMEPPFELDGTPVPVVFEGLSVKVWQDFSNKGELKLSVTATAIKPIGGKQIKIGGNEA